MYYEFETWNNLVLFRKRKEYSEAHDEKICRQVKQLKTVLIVDVVLWGYILNI